MNKIRVDFDSYQQEVEFDSSITNVEVLGNSPKNFYLRKRGIICFFLGMLVMALYFKNQSTYDSSAYVIISQEAYYDLHKNHNMKWDSKKRTWVKVPPSP